MECITFLEFREENQLSNANQIYFPAVFIQTSIHDSGIPHDPHRKFSEPQCRVLFSPPERTAFYTGSLLFGSFILFGIAFVIGSMPYRSPDPSKASLKQHVCTVPTKRDARALTGGKNLGASGERAPTTFSVPCKKGLVSRSWHLPGFGS